VKKFIYIILFLFTLSCNLKAQKYTDAQLKGAIIFKIINNVYWPNEDSLQNFNIFFFGGDNNFLKQIKNFKYLKIRKKQIKITYSDAFFDLPPNTPQVIIVSKDREKDLNEIFSKIKGKPILLITDNAENQDLTMINLIQSEIGISFETNKKNIENQKLLISPKLLIIGGQIEEVRQLYKQQEQKLYQVRKQISSLLSDIEAKQQRIKKQQASIDSQMFLIKNQKKQIVNQNNSILKQKQQIQEQKFYLKKLLTSIEAQSDTLQNKKFQLANQKMIFNKQKQLLASQKAQMNESKKLYDSIKVQIDTQRNILNKQKILIKLQKRGLVVAIIILSLLFILAIIIYRSYRMKKRINEELEQKNHLIKKQNEELKTQSEVLKNQSEELKTQAEELMAINTELEKLSIVASKTDNSVIIMYPNGEIEWVNESFINFYGEELYEQIFNSKINIKDFRDIDEMYFVTEEYLKKKKSYNFIEKYKNNNKEIWIQTSLTPILSKNNNIKRIIAVDTDITQTKKTEEILAQHNRDIKQSITYASRIQGALLPQKIDLSQIFKDNFILYRPRDIVSGDFYWIGKKMDKIIFAAADCTGHGVPGAFMSMLGTSLLNSVTNTIFERYGEQFLKPGFILGRVRKMIIRLLHQQGTREFTDSKDGMDMALCVYSPKEKTLEYAGANNSLYLIRQKNIPSPELDKKIMRTKENENFVLYEIKPDKMPVGISLRSNEKFTDKKFILMPNDLIYIFSDGFSDQFGGPDNRKFMSGNLKKLLLSIAHLPMNEQKDALDKELDYWLSFRKDSKHSGQTDDILIWGIRF
jgi:PAS domain S-box-containing protein